MKQSMSLQSRQNQTDIMSNECGGSMRFILFPLMDELVTSNESEIRHIDHLSRFLCSIS